MRKSLLILLLFELFAKANFAQDSLDRSAEFRIYYGAYYNKWGGYNRLLSSNNLDGRFNNLSFNNFGWGAVTYIKKLGWEWSFDFTGQSYETNGRRYDGEGVGLKLLANYELFNKHKFLIHFFSGFNFQALRLEVDTINNTSLAFNNYFSSHGEKDILYLPVGLDFTFRFSRKPKHLFKLPSNANAKKIRSGFLLGLRVDYNIRTYEADWIQNNNNYSSPLNDPNYFEALLFGGFYFN